MTARPYFTATLAVGNGVREDVTFTADSLAEAAKVATDCYGTSCRAVAYATVEDAMREEDRQNAAMRAAFGIGA